MKKILLPALIALPLIAMSFTTQKVDKSNLEIASNKLDNSLIASMDVNGLMSFTSKDSFSSTTSLSLNKGTLHKTTFSTKDTTQTPDPAPGPIVSPGFNPLKVLVEKYA